jgi:hypothetical protein
MATVFVTVADKREYVVTVTDVTEYLKNRFALIKSFSVDNDPEMWSKLESASSWRLSLMPSKDGSAVCITLFKFPIS